MKLEKTENICICIPVSLSEQIDTLTLYRGYNRSEVVAEALRQYFDELEVKEIWED